MACFFNKKSIFLFVLACFFQVSISHAMMYSPGETLSPECGPTDIDCGIITPVFTNGEMTNGALLFASSTSWNLLPSGTDGQVLKISSGLPVWSTDINTTYTAFGNGLELNGSQFSLILDGSTISSSTSGLKINDTLVSNWNTAYGWGNHAGLYLPIGATATNSLMLGGHDSSHFQTALGFTPYNATNPAGYISSYTETDPLISAWAKASTKPTYTASEVGLGNVPNISFSGSNTGDETSSTIKTKLGFASSTADGYLTSVDWSIFNSKQPAGSYLTGTKADSFNTRTGAVTLLSTDVIDALTFTPYNATNPAGYISSYTETDPLISAWAKASTKPTYTASEVGLGNVTNESKATMFTSPVFTGTVGFGNLDITGDIIPTANEIYSLGSATKFWKDIYVGQGSLYVNGQKVLQTDTSNSVVISSDPDQNLILKTTNGGNIELNSFTGGGQILLKSNIVLTGGKTFGTSDNSKVIFPEGISTPSISTFVLNGGIEIAPNGNGNTYVTNGNFGIGTVNPTFKLDVAGTLRATGAITAATSTNTINGLIINSGALSGITGMTMVSGNLDMSTGLITNIGNSGTDFDSNGGLTLASALTLSGTSANIVLGSNYLSGDGGDEGIYVDSVGNVGIGTSSPSYKLDVMGDINATGTIRLSGNDFGQYFIDSAGTNGQLWQSDGSGRGAWVATSSLGIAGGGGTPAGSTGQIQFNDGGAFGATSTLFWNNTNGRLGIGTATPGSALSIAGGDIAMGDSNNNFISSFNPTNMNPSYFDSYSFGNRTSIITVTGNTILGAGTLSNFIDGLTTYDLYFTQQTASGKYLRFDFGENNAKIVTEASFRQYDISSHGNWKWQGSNNAVDWSDIGSGFTFGGTILQRQTSLNSNTTAYRYYQLLGLSGNISGQPWLYEFEFKVSVSSPLAIQQVYKTNGTTAGGVLALQSYGGSVGIGTNNPYANFHINYNASSTSMNFPALLLGTDALTYTTSATMGTYLGINAPSTFTGNFLRFQSNNVDIFTLKPDGNITTGGTGGLITAPKLNATAYVDTPSIWTNTINEKAGANNANIVLNSSKYITLSTNGNERIRIISSGYVGIGTTSPQQKLDVAGVIRQSGCVTAGGLSVNSSGDIICDPSSEKFKNNIVDLADGLSTLTSLRPVSYKFNQDMNMGGGVHFGFISEDVNSVMPELATHDSQGAPYGLDTNAILAVSIKAMLELNGMVVANTSTTNALLADIDLLKTQITSLQNRSAGGINFDTLNKLTVSGALAVAGHVAMGTDSVGEATLLAGDTSVVVSFAEVYTEKPIITISKNTQGVIADYYIDEITPNNFKIKIDTIQARDIIFSWHAFAQKGKAFEIPVENNTTQNPEPNLVSEVVDSTSTDSMASSTPDVPEENTTILPPESTPPDTEVTNPEPVETEETVVSPIVPEQATVLEVAPAETPASQI